MAKWGPLVPGYTIGRQLVQPIIGTLLKAQVEIQGLPAGDGLQQCPERRWRRRVRPGLPAALEDAAGITPALHVPQRAGPGRERGRERGWEPPGAGGPGRPGPRQRLAPIVPPLPAPGGGETWRPTSRTRTHRRPTPNGGGWPARSGPTNRPTPPPLAPPATLARPTGANRRAPQAPSARPPA